MPPPVTLLDLCVALTALGQMQEFILVGSIPQPPVPTPTLDLAPSNLLTMSLFLPDPHPEHDILFTVQAARLTFAIALKLILSLFFFFSPFSLPFYFVSRTLCPPPTNPPGVLNIT